MMGMGGKKRSAGCKRESITGLSVPEGELLFIASPCCVPVMSYPPTPSKAELCALLNTYRVKKKKKKRKEKRTQPVTHFE